MNTLTMQAAAAIVTGMITLRAKESITVLTPSAPGDPGVHVAVGFATLLSVTRSLMATMIAMGGPDMVSLETRNRY